MGELIAGFAAPFLIYGIILGLHMLLPARRVDGYVRDAATGSPLRYRLNGLLVLAVLMGLWLIAGRLSVLPLDWLYLHRFSALAGACVLGLIASFWIVLRAPSTGKPFLIELYLGRLENPQFAGGRVDAKMFLYLAGAAMLALNVASFLAHHVMLYGTASSPGAILYAWLFFWFICEYLFFERVHLYTYDIFAERTGFKLVWGCFTFYPYFYGIGLWSAAELPDPGTPLWQLIIYAAVFFSGWMLARGANMQKYRFKTEPEKPFLGFMSPGTIRDDHHTILCSGFWGVTRHINYLGEILMATGLTLCLGYPALWLAWLYPLYYVALLFPRERADDRRCARKYGALWDEYRRRVPKRIIPFIY